MCVPLMHRYVSKFYNGEIGLKLVYHNLSHIVMRVTLDVFAG